MAEIRLANGKGVALIDDDDAVRIPVSGWWNSNGYACRHYRTSAGKRGTLGLHRLVMNAPDGMDVDHVNHDKLDCRKANLRLVTESQNLQNRRGADRRSLTGVRGVSAYSTKGGTRFLAFVHVDKKPIRRFGFRSLEDASRAAVELRRAHLTHSQECS